MSTYRVYDEHYSGFSENDLESVDFVEVDNAVLDCVKAGKNLYRPSIRKLLNVVNVKVKDIPTFVKRNIILSPQQVVKQAINDTTDYTDGSNYMYPNQFAYKHMMEELENEEEQMSVTDDKFFNLLQEAEKYCPTAINANKKYEEQLTAAWNSVPNYNGYTGATTEQNATITRTCGYLTGENMSDRETLDVPMTSYNDPLTANNDYCSSNIVMTPSTFDDKPITSFNIDADAIFTSNKSNENTIDVSELDKLSIDNSTLLQGSCLDMFNDTIDKFGNAKFKEPEHTSPAKLEKQKRIEVYHKRHNRKKNR